VTIVSLFLLLIYVSQDGTVKSEPQTEPYLFKAKTIHGELTIQVASPIVYLPKGAPKLLSDFVSIQKLEKDGKEVEVIAGYFDTQPKPIRPKLADSTEYSLQRNEGDSTWILFEKVGKIDLLIQFGEQILSAPIEIKKIPVDVGDHKDVVVDAYGLPDEVTPFFVKWPDSEWHNGVFYTVTAKQGFRQIDQWRYKQMPNLILSIEKDRVVSIDSAATKLDSVRFPEHFREVFTKEIEKMQNNQVMDPPPEDKAPPAPDSTDYRVWRDVKGQVVRAKFVKYLNDRVYLQLEDGKSLVLKVNQLTKESADLARELNIQARKKKK
jgi:hypothetical protein